MAHFGANTKVRNIHICFAGIEGYDFTGLDEAKIIATAEAKMAEGGVKGSESVGVHTRCVSNFNLEFSIFFFFCYGPPWGKCHFLIINPKECARS